MSKMVAVAVKVKAPTKYDDDGHMGLPTGLLCIAVCTIHSVDEHHTICIHGIYPGVRQMTMR